MLGFAGSRICFSISCAFGFLPSPLCVFTAPLTAWEPLHPAGPGLTNLLARLWAKLESSCPEARLLWSNRDVGAPALLRGNSFTSQGVVFPEFISW